MKKKKAPGKAYRQGVSLIELMDWFPDEAAAQNWFEARRWNGQRTCPRCGNGETTEAPSGSMPYWCTPCRAYFSVRTGTVLERSKVPLRKWVLALYLVSTNLKSVSSMKLHRDLNITQKTAWFLLHRIREAWANKHAQKLLGPVEIDETFIGGIESNKHVSKRQRMGRGPTGKAAVMGLKSQTTNQIRAQTVWPLSARMLQGAIRETVEPGAVLYTDQNSAYRSLSRKGFTHHAVNHSVGQYVNDMAHTNGIESFWALLKRGYHGTFHHVSEEHLERYVNEFAGRHNIRELDTKDQMEWLVENLQGKRLTYAGLIGKA